MVLCAAIARTMNARRVLLYMPTIHVVNNRWRPQMHHPHEDCSGDAQLSQNSQDRTHARTRGGATPQAGRARAPG